MKTTEEIIKEAKKQKSYTNRSNRVFTEKQKKVAKSLIPKIVNQCKNWKGYSDETDTFNPFDKLARALKRAGM